LRSTQLKKWKKPGRFQRIMIKAGFDPKEAHRVWIKMNRWQSVTRRPVRFVMITPTSALMTTLCAQVLTAGDNDDAVRQIVSVEYIQTPALCKDLAEPPGNVLRWRHQI
jgi:hypothetical protein